jgi:predicted AAA+ superfamily ATPase
MTSHASRKAKGIVARHLAPRVIESLGNSRVVSIVGPRQVGKSTLVERQVPIAEYLTMDDDQLRGAIELDPHTVLAEFAKRHKASRKPIVIDEVQRVPDVSIRCAAPSAPRGRR